MASLQLQSKGAKEAAGACLARSGAGWRVAAPGCLLSLTTGPKL